MSEDCHIDKSEQDGAKTDPYAGGGRAAEVRVLTPEERKDLLSSSPVAICILQRDQIYWANPEFYRMTGHPPGSLEGREALTFYPTPKEYDRVRNRLMSEIDRFGTGTTDTRLLRQDNTPFDCRIRASRVDLDNSARGIMITASDISEIKSAQIQRQQAQKMEAIGVLAGGISHDFNNLLMGIQGHLSLMRINVNRPDKVGHHIRQMGKLVETAADLTGRLLGFARGGKYQTTALDVNQVVSMAMNIFEPTHDDILIREELEDGLHAVNGDHSQLEQVLLNLMVNASQAMIDGGTLTVGTRNIQISRDNDYHFAVATGTYVEILVRDTGVGMDEAVQKKIFDPFFSTKEAGDRKGRGLGLSTVFGIVKNHGGFITVESRPGEGSCFRVCLPGSEDPAELTEAQGAASLEQMPRGSETVLLVDDEEAVLNVGKNYLEKLGYTPLLARNGLEALEIFKLYQKEISLVVLDLVMPIMDGKQVFYEIKTMVPEIKVLVSTGFNVDEEVGALLKEGCHGFLQKPFSMDKFSKVLREILDRPSVDPVHIIGDH